MKFEEYFLLYLSLGDNEKTPFSKVRFWACTLLFIAVGLKIQMKNGHFLTKFDCFIEMNDVWRDYEFEGGDTRAWWEQNQWLRGGKKPYWIE